MELIMNDHVVQKKRKKEMKQKHKYAPTYCIHNEGFPETKTHFKIQH